MKKIGCLIFLLFLTNCAYSPVIDTAGRSGTYNEDKAKEITNDLQHCKMVADTNSSFWSGVIFWVESPTADTQHESIYRKCLINRGHSVLNQKGKMKTKQENIRLLNKLIKAESSISDLWLALDEDKSAFAHIDVN